MSVDVTFKPLGGSQLLPATGAQLQAAGASGIMNAVLFVNIGTTVAYIAWGGTAANAAANLPAAPAAGTIYPNSIALPVNGRIVLEVPPGLYFAATATSVFATPGTGGN